MRSRDDRGIGHLPSPAEVLGGVARSAAGVPRPAPAASSHSDRWTHDVIVNVGEAGPVDLIVQAVVLAALAGHGNFQGVEIFPVLPGRCLRAGTAVWRRISPC